MYFRKIALASFLAGGMALPAAAQTVTQDTTPAAKTDPATPLPDAGLKKAPPGSAKHVHRTTHVARKAKTDAPAKAK